MVILVTILIFISFIIGLFMAYYSAKDRSCSVDNHDFESVYENADHYDAIYSGYKYHVCKKCGKIVKQE